MAVDAPALALTAHAARMSACDMQGNAGPDLASLIRAPR
jgi:hypothetical protein